MLLFIEGALDPEVGKSGELSGQGPVQATTLDELRDGLPLLSGRFDELVARSDIAQTDVSCSTTSIPAAQRSHAITASCVLLCMALTRLNVVRPGSRTSPQVQATASLSHL